jgi:hypothetical protein
MKLPNRHKKIRVPTDSDQEVEVHKEEQSHSDDEFNFEGLLSTDNEIRRYFIISILSYYIFIL